jgi:hypothetical protein
VPNNNKLAKKPLNINENWVLYTKIRKSVTRVESALVVELKVINRSAINNVLILRTLLANLWFVSLHDNQLLTPINRSNDKKDKPVNAKKKLRRTNRYSRFVANEILDKLVKAGYVKREKGRANSFECVATWCVATKKLLHLIAQFEDESDKNVSIFSKLNPELVILRNASKEPEKIRTTYVRKAKKLAEPARLMNQLLESIDVTLAEYVDGILTVKPLFPFLYRVFNILDNFSLGGRFYDKHCNYSQEKRSRIFIDGEPTCEVDFSALHPTMLYADRGLPMKDNPYNFHKDREFCKSLIVRIINSKTKAGFCSSVTKSGNPKVKAILRRHEKIQEWKDKLSSGEHYPAELADWKLDDESLEERLTNFSEKKYAGYIRNVKLGFFEGVPDNTKGEIVYDLIMKEYSSIAHKFGEENLGLLLQNKDSEIMSLVLTKLATKGIVALPVHDSVVVKKCHKDEAIRAMKESFTEVCNGFSITVEEK